MSRRANKKVDKDLMVNQYSNVSKIGTTLGFKTGREGVGRGVLEFEADDLHFRPNFDRTKERKTCKLLNPYCHLRDVTLHAASKLVPLSEGVHVSLSCMSYLLHMNNV